jgi:basic amino acid/polyamine antiporter, APA family
MHNRTDMQQLERRLGLLDTTMIIVGIVIGSGIFLLPNLIARSLQSGPAMIAVWVVAGVLSWFGALAYAELGAMMPATAGQYVYIREAYGDLAAFLCGWVLMMVVTPGGIAFLATGFSIYAGQFVALSAGERKLLAVGLVVAISAINYLGVRESAWTQRVFTTAKIAGLAIVIGAALLARHVSAPAAAVAGRGVHWNGIGYSLTACLMAYNGWSYVSWVAGEVRQPGKNLPRALALGMGTVMLLYLGANFAYMNVMTVPQIAAAERVGAAVAERTFGSAGANLLAAIVLASVVGAINGCVLTGSRIPFGMARDGLFFRKFGAIQPRFQTPGFAIIVQAAWSSIVVLTGSYETLSSYAMLSAWLFYTLTVIAVSIFRRTMPEAERPYRMWGYPATAWIFVAVSIWFFADALVHQTATSLLSIGVTLAGAPFYWIWRKAPQAVAV